MSLYEEMESGFDQMTEPMKARLQEIAFDRARLMDNKKIRALEAQLSLLQGKLTEDLAKEKDEAPRLKEIAGVKDELDTLTDARQKRLSELGGEYQQLTARLGETASQILKVNFDDAVDEVFVKLTAWLDAVEETYRDGSKFAAQHGLNLPNAKARLQLHRHNLYRPSSKELHERVAQWIR